MSSYAMYGTGQFGGSNNLLSMLGGIGTDWANGTNLGMQQGMALMQYNNALATNPSALRAQIAQNIANEGTSTGNHYRNYMDNQVLSYLAGGGNPADPNSPFNQWWGQQRIGALTGTNMVQGTPVNTQPNSNPTTQVAQPVAVNPAGTPISGLNNMRGY